VRSRPLGDQPVRLDSVPPDHPGALLARWVAASEWLSRAACGDADPGWFFVESTKGDPESLASKRLLAGMELCATCEVRRECLDSAIEMESDGVWGGSTEHDRARVSHLPRAEAVAELERTLPERLELRRASQLRARRAAKTRK